MAIEGKTLRKGSFKTRLENATRKVNQRYTYTVCPDKKVNTQNELR